MSTSIVIPYEGLVKKDEIFMFPDRDSILCVSDIDISKFFKIFGYETYSVEISHRRFMCLTNPKDKSSLLIDGIENVQLPILENGYLLGLKFNRFAYLHDGCGTKEFDLYSLIKMFPKNITLQTLKNRFLATEGEKKNDLYKMYF